MDTRLKLYYRKKMYGGRSLVARIVDFVILRVMMLFILFLVFLYALRSLVPALLISVLITLAASLLLIVIKRRKANIYMQKDMQRLKKKCLLESLTVMDHNVFKDYMNRLFDGKFLDVKDTANGFTAAIDKQKLYVFHNHPMSQSNVADVLLAYRTLGESCELIIVSLASYSKEATTFSAALDNPVTLISGDDVLKLAEKKNMLPDDEAANEKVNKEMSDTVVTIKKIKKAALNRVKIRAYIICGIVIMCWPLISDFRFYYPIISLVCFVLAIISYRKSRQDAKQEGIGIS